MTPEQLTKSRERYAALKRRAQKLAASHLTRSREKARNETRHHDELEHLLEEFYRFQAKINASEKRKRRAEAS